MKSHSHGITRDIAPFKMSGMAIPYAEFVPKLYNFCCSLGFKRNYIMPSRAFCSDENQGFSIILITNHFGTFPFDHGQVGGVIDLNRHAPHAAHGQDSVIIQASHVGYDPETGEYGYCKRPKMSADSISSSCGRLTHVVEPFLRNYNFAKQRIFLHRNDQGEHLITVKDTFIDFPSKPITNGLVLRLDKIGRLSADNQVELHGTHSTSHTYEVSEEFRKKVDSNGHKWKGGIGEAIGDHLTSDLFFYREDIHEDADAVVIERNLLEFMPVIVTHKCPTLKAAKVNVQMEFARTLESIHLGSDYQGKNLLYISGLNIDIAAYKDAPETTYFVPWAAYVQFKDVCPEEEYTHPIEQVQLYKKLMEQSTVNPDQVNIKGEIDRMLESPRYEIHTPR